MFWCDEGFSLEAFQVMYLGLTLLLLGVTYKFLPLFHLWALFFLEP